MISITFFCRFTSIEFVALFFTLSLPSLPELAGKTLQLLQHHHPVHVIYMFHVCHVIFSSPFHSCGTQISCVERENRCFEAGSHQK